MDLDNPFNSLGTTEDDTPETEAPSPTVTPPQEEAAIPDQASGEDEDFEFDFGDFGDLDLALEESDFVQDEYRPYQMPADKAWVPIRVKDSKITTREMMMRVLVKDSSTGESVVKERAKALHFEIAAEHVAEIYGTHQWDLNFNIPIPDLSIPWRNGKGIYEKKAGRNFIAATRTLPRGEALTKDALKKVRDSSKSKIVMAQVRRSEGTRSVSENAMDSNNNPLKCMADAEGEPIRIFKIGGTLLLSDGSPYQGEVKEEDLIKQSEGMKVANPQDPDETVEAEAVFVIPDSSGNGVNVQIIVQKPRIYENYQDDVKPVPGKALPAASITDEIRKYYTLHENPNGTVFVERLVQITRTNNTVVSAQVTWDTVGQMVKDNRDPGTAIQAVIPSTGELLTATWLGTMWMETEVPHVVGLDEKGDLKFQALESREDGKSEPDLSGLDIFKGE